MGLNINPNKTKIVEKRINSTLNVDVMQEPIGENTFLKLREQRDQARLECDFK